MRTNSSVFMTAVMSSVLALGLAACGSDDSSVSNEALAATVQEQAKDCTAACVQECLDVEGADACVGTCTNTCVQERVQLAEQLKCEGDEAACDGVKAQVQERVRVRARVHAGECGGACLQKREQVREQERLNICPQDGVCEQERVTARVQTRMHECSAQCVEESPLEDEVVEVFAEYDLYAGVVSGDQDMLKAQDQTRIQDEGADGDGDQTQTQTLDGELAGDGPLAQTQPGEGQE